jgi:hypothetical protein
MKDTVVLNVNSNAKVWAFSIEMAYRKSLEGHRVILLDTTQVPPIGFVSFSRKRFEKEILKLTGVEIVKYRYSMFEYIRENCNAWNKFFDGKRRKSFPNVKRGGVDLSKILQARISTYLGVRDYDFSEVPWRVFRKHFVTSAISSTFFAKHFPKTESLVFAYNGREVMSAVLLQHAFSSGFRTVIGERGSDNGKFQLFDNSPHFHPNWWHLISTYVNSDLSDDLLSQRVLDYKQSKLTGFDTYFSDIWNPPKELVKGRGLDVSGYVLFLSSSSTEYSPFDQYNANLGYLNQFEAVQILASACLDQNQVLVVRRHPKSIGVDGVDREEKFWNTILSLSNVIYIGPKEDYSSYKLVEDARVVFVWKSSMGYESMLMGKPTYALGTSKWAWDPNLQCWTQLRVSECIGNPRIEFESKEILDKYSQFMATSGTRFLLFNSVDKWGVVTKSNARVFNLFLERFRRKIYDYFLLLTNRNRKRNA